jgi:hypothetical protein
MFKSMRNVLVAVAALAALALGGSAIASATTGSSSPSGSTASSSTSGSSRTATPQTRPAFPPHGSAAHEDAEKPVTGAAAEKAQAAAVKSVGSGTAGAVTTDFTQKGYEVTVTKSDGTKVEVHLDSSFNVMRGPGGPGGPGGHGGPGGAGGHGGPGGPGGPPPSGSAAPRSGA